MNDLPQCLTTVRFHELVLGGEFGEREARALETDRRLGDKYRALRSCDEAFNAMLYAGNVAASQKDANSAPQKPPQLLYAEYMHCASSVLCEKPLMEWGRCVNTMQTHRKDISHCAQAKRLLERCMRGKSEELLKASQPQVFRPSATP